MFHRFSLCLQRRSSAWSAPSLFRSIWGKVLVWWGTCSGWQKKTPPPSSSSTRSTPSQRSVSMHRPEVRNSPTFFIHVVFSPCPARDCLRDELGRLTSLFPLQLTGKCRESYSSCSIRWTDSTRMSTSRWAEPLNCFPLWLHHISACWLELHFIHCIVITASAAIQLREHPRGSRRHSSAP